tara:strand:+ start:195 stop:608 length:414 start_codon:yes stop_codon:yes gene_type:complete
MLENEYISAALESLKKSPLKITTQRIDIIKILFKAGNCHFTAEDVHLEVQRSGLNISLATVYNCLNQFTKYKILKSVRTSCDKVYFDTNTSLHHHFFCRSTSKLIDIKSKEVKFSKLPKIPGGKKLQSVEVVVNISD